MIKTKRLFALLLCLSLALGLCACGGGSGRDAVTSPGDIFASPGDAYEDAYGTPGDMGWEYFTTSGDAASVLTYEAAARAVREEFIQVTREGLDSFDEAAHPELPWYTAVLTRFEENRYWESYYDFDGNGVPEMLIAVGDEENKTPIAVYAFDGQNMHYLCKGAPLGERSYLSRKDGLFIVHGSGGAASGALTVYLIAEDGWSTVIVDEIDYEYSDDGRVTYTSRYGTISPEEVVSRGLADSIGLDVDPIWSCFWPD